MWLLAIVLLTLTTSLAESDQSAVEAVLQQMEHAEQTGDFNTWLGLWTREKAAEMEKMRGHTAAQPQVRYRATTTFVHGDKAVLLVEAPAVKSFLTVTLRKEDGQWKVKDELWRDTAPDPVSVHALAPPDPGAFARAGSPWDKVPAAMDASQAARLGWQMRSVFDEAYLYIRIESGADLPAPGSRIEGPPPGSWPSLRIGVSGAAQFELYDRINIGDQATFGKDGRANSHRPYAAYMIRLERNHREVFSASADLDPSPLIDVAGRNYDIRIPLATMGVRDSRTARITVGDTQWPRPGAIGIAVQRYPR